MDGVRIATERLADYHGSTGTSTTRKSTTTTIIIWKMPQRSAVILTHTIFLRPWLYLNYHDDENGDYNYVVEHQAGYPCCASCCASCRRYLVEDEDEYWSDNDTDTDEDDHQVTLEMSAPELQQSLGDMTDATYENLEGEYLWAKRRSRQSGKKALRLTHSKTITNAKMVMTACGMYERANGGKTTTR
jgi:hypothetical protein